MRLISMVDVRGCLLLLGFGGTLLGCSSTYVLYTQGHAPVSIPPPDRALENPDAYRVNPTSFPKYIAKSNFTGPNSREGVWVSKVPPAEILTSDVWRVTHKVGDRLLIFSDSYQDRQCNHLLEYGKFKGAFKSPLGGGCRSDYLYGLYILQDGHAKGWVLLRNPKTFVLSKDRYAVMDPALCEGPGWPEEPLFQTVAN